MLFSDPQLACQPQYATVHPASDSGNSTGTGKLKIISFNIIPLALFYSYVIHCIYFVLSLLQRPLYLVIPNSFIAQDSTHPLSNTYNNLSM